MKKITEDLMITGIDISIARLGATVKFKYCDEYEAKAWYLRQSSGNQWLESGDEVNTRTHDDITEEVENNEEEILSWLEEQFANETDKVDPEKVSYDFLQLQKLQGCDLAAIAHDYGVNTTEMGRQNIMYKILEKQAEV